MASTYSTSLKLELIGTGEQAGLWGITTNTNLGTALEQAIVGKADITMSSTSITLTLTNSNAAQNARAVYLNLTGAPGGAATLEVPAVQKPYIVKNGSNQVVTVKVSGQTGVAVPVGKTMWLYNNGTDVVNAIDNLPVGTTIGGNSIVSGNINLASQVTGILPSANGGTSNAFFEVSGPATTVKTYTFPNETMSVGFRAIPQSGTAKTSGYTLATSDIGKLIEVGASGGITIPNATFTAGDAVLIVNNTTGNITITCSISTAYIGGVNTNRSTITLATRGVANVLFISGTVCVVTGNVT